MNALQGDGEMGRQSRDAMQRPKCPWVSDLLHEQIGHTAEDEDGRDGPKQNDWHGSLLLVARVGTKNAFS